MTRDPAAARKIWRRLEPIHAVTYFAPEAHQALADVGYRGFWMNYFAARAAPLGAVGPEIVGALFYNFSVERVTKALPEAWAIGGPESALDARLAGAVAALRRALGDLAAGDEVAEAAELARRAASTAPIEGRALFAANAALPWPDDPLAVLWQAATLLREHRGDGHVALLLSLGLGGRESNVFQSLAGNVPRSMIELARDYTDAEWTAVVARLADRDLLTADGVLTSAGSALRQQLEDRTDALALAGYGALDNAALTRLTELLGPLARAVVATGEIPAATPMGPTLDD